MEIILAIIILYFISSHYERKNEEEISWCYDYRLYNIKHPKLTNDIMKKHGMFVGTTEWLEEKNQNK